MSLPTPSNAFWSDPPWANGNGGHQMQLKPLVDADWCPRQITEPERASKQKLLNEHFATTTQAVKGSENAQQLVARAIGGRFPLSNTTTLRQPELAAQAIPLVASALTVPEDLCLMQRDSDEYRLVAACVCAPSYWQLPEKIGLTLSQIHQPVPGLNDSLADRMGEFFNKLPANRIFSRRNWLIHTSSERFQPAPEERLQLHTLDQAKALVMRSETQTLRRLSEKVVVFTINIECHPLVDISAYPSAASALKQALLSRNKKERAAASQDTYHDAVLQLLDNV